MELKLEYFLAYVKVIMAFDLVRLSPIFGYFIPA